jgi:hypothetical protein
MHPLLLEILPLVRQGWCCSQLLAVLLLRVRGEENPELVRAMHALCHGIGESDGPCGLLTGGACVLGCLAGRGEEKESAFPLFIPLVNDYALWFYERTERYGGHGCGLVVRGLSADAGTAAPEGKPAPTLCGALLAECWEKILALAEEYEIPMDGR